MPTLTAATHTEVIFLPTANHFRQCDEQGPPCANCVVRNTACVYATSGVRQVSLGEQSSDLVAADGEPEENLAEPLPTADPSRLLELELMHRWATVTYKSVCTIPEEYPLAQCVVPRVALKYEFLLNGIFATSALELAASSSETEAATYVRAGLEYYDRASSAFRAELSSVTSENHLAVLMFSLMATAINVAIPQFHHDGTGHESNSMLSRVAVLFDLINGAASIALVSMDWLLGSSLSHEIQAVTPIQENPSNFLDSSISAALERLCLINKALHPGLDGEPNSKEYDGSSTYESYANAISNLERCFAEDARGVIKCYCILFPSLAGQNYALFLKDSQPLAFLILMHWAVLLDRIEKDYWWATMVGKNLMGELFRHLQTSPMAQQVDWRRAMLWTFEQIGHPIPAQLTGNLVVIDPASA
jgi:hypothetical protein